MLVALVALFMSLGGVGYAATQLPNNSVGSAQLQNNAVTYKKITPGAVGNVRANLSQLQARVNGTCSAGQAIGAVGQNGQVTCNNALPAQFGTTSNSANLPSNGSAASVTSVNLPAGASYLALANPTAAVAGSGTNQRVTVSCTLTVGSNTQSRSATATTGTSTSPTSVSIPLQVAGAAGTSSVSCQARAETGILPATSVTSAINAVQTSGNG